MFFLGQSGCEASNKSMGFWAGIKIKKIIFLHFTSYDFSSALLRPE